MHFLFTGPISNMTDKSYNSNRSRLKVFTTTDGLISALEFAGHKVTAKIVIPGEDLSMYDQVIIGLASLYSNMSNFTPGMFWAISQFSDPLFTLNDWRANDAFKIFKSSGGLESFIEKFVKTNNEGISKLNKTTDYYYAVKSNLDILLETEEKITKSIHKIIFPAYPNFNKDNLNINNPIIRYNPGAFMPQNEYGSFVEVKNKSLSHVIAGAAKPNWSWFKKLDKKWTDLESAKNSSKWGIEVYGPWCKNPLAEEKLTKVFEDNISMILPSYKDILGVGMWRPRHVMAYNTGSLVICDSEEGKIFGEGYGKHSIQEIESMTSSELQDLIYLQNQSFCKSIESKEQVLNQLKDVL